MKRAHVLGADSVRHRRLFRFVTRLHDENVARTRPFMQERNQADGPRRTISNRSERRIAH